MGVEEVQRRFENVLAELNELSEKKSIPQDAVKCNEYGVFIDFAGVEVNYSHYSLDDNLQDYLTAQAEKHERFLRVLQIYKAQRKKELKSYDGLFHSLQQRFSKPSKEELEKTIDKAMVKVAFGKVIKEGAMLGKYFFEEIVVDYTETKFDDLRQKLVQNTQNIHDLAKDIELLDTQKLQYFRNKELLWYGKQG